MNCPHCSATQEEGFVVKRWGACCRRCGFGMSKGTRKDTWLERFKGVLLVVLFTATVIITVLSMAYSLPGYPSAMFRTDKIAIIAKAEQSKIWHSVFK